MKQHKLHKRLKSARVRSGLSLREVERLSKRKVSDVYFSKLENGQLHNPHPYILRAICKVLNLDYLHTMMVAGYVTSADLRKWGR